MSVLCNLGSNLGINLLWEVKIFSSDQDTSIIACGSRIILRVNVDFSDIIDLIEYSHDTSMIHALNMLQDSTFPPEACFNEPALTPTTSGVSPLQQ